MATLGHCSAVKFVITAIVNKRAIHSLRLSFPWSQLWQAVSLVEAN